MMRVLLVAAVIATMAFASPIPHIIDIPDPVPCRPHVDGSEVGSTICHTPSLQHGDDQGESRSQGRDRIRRQSESGLFRPSAGGRGVPSSVGQPSRGIVFQGPSNSGRRDEPFNGRERRPTRPTFGGSGVFSSRDQPNSRDEDYPGDFGGESTEEPSSGSEGRPPRPRGSGVPSSKDEPNSRDEEYQGTSGSGKREPPRRSNGGPYMFYPRGTTTPYPKYGRKDYGLPREDDEEYHVEHSTKKSPDEHYLIGNHEEVKPHAYKPVKETHGGSTHESPLPKDHTYGGGRPVYKPVQEHYGSEHQEPSLPKKQPHGGERPVYKPVKEHYGSEHQEPSLPKKQPHGGERPVYKPVKEHYGSEHQEPLLPKKQPHGGERPVYKPVQEHYGSEHQEPALPKRQPHGGERPVYKPIKEQHEGDFHEYMNKRPASYGSGVSSHIPNLYEKPMHVLHTVISNKPVVPLKSQ